MQIPPMDLGQNIPLDRQLRNRPPGQWTLSWNSLLPAQIKDGGKLAALAAQASIPIFIHRLRAGGFFPLAFLREYRHVCASRSSKETWSSSMSSVARVRGATERRSAPSNRDTAARWARALRSTVKWAKPYLGVAATFLMFSAIILGILASKTAIFLSRMHW
jgi:hypothetical protein